MLCTANTETLPRSFRDLDVERQRGSFRDLCREITRHQSSLPFSFRRDKIHTHQFHWHARQHAEGQGFRAQRFRHDVQVEILALRWHDCEVSSFIDATHGNESRMITGSQVQRRTTIDWPVEHDSDLHLFPRHCPSPFGRHGGDLERLVIVAQDQALDVAVRYGQRRTGQDRDCTENDDRQADDDAQPAIGKLNQATAPFFREGCFQAAHNQYPDGLAARPVEFGREPRFQIFALIGEQSQHIPADQVSQDSAPATRPDAVDTGQCRGHEQDPGGRREFPWRQVCGRQQVKRECAQAGHGQIDPDPHHA